jgi:hypothetical protein
MSKLMSKWACRGGGRFLQVVEEFWLRGRDLNPRPLGYEFCWPFLLFLARVSLSSTYVLNLLDSPRCFLLFPVAISRNSGRTAAALSVVCRLCSSCRGGLRLGANPGGYFNREAGRFAAIPDVLAKGFKPAAPCWACLGPMMTDDGVMAYGC